MKNFDIAEVKALDRNFEISFYFLKTNQVFTYYVLLSSFSRASKIKSLATTFSKLMNA